jgi:hypothetical protein
MNNSMKTVYGLIVVLFLSIIVGSTFLRPDYETVEVKDLELTVDTIQSDYEVGQVIIFNVYLTNNHPYKVRVTLPDQLSNYQAPVNWMGSVSSALKQIEDRNKTIILDPYSDYYLATLGGTQLRTGRFEIHIRCEELEKVIYVNITDTSIPDYIERLDIWIPTNFNTVNYTGLPEGEDVRIYPESHIISGNTFKIVFENNRDENLYWGSEWKAEKWINGEWTYQDPNWVWTMELRIASPYSKVVDSFSFLFDEGLYRITKRCMLSDNYDRDKHEWVDEFTATFYIIKTQ